jgi:hypothetical protein
MLSGKARMHLPKWRHGFANWWRLYLLLVGGLSSVIFPAAGDWVVQTIIGKSFTQKLLCVLQ